MLPAPCGDEERAVEPVLSARDVGKAYRMGEVEVTALTGVDLVLEAGELVVILGPSGSGKSTLLNLLGGLDVPTSGTIAYRRQLLDSANTDELVRYRRDHVGFVFQFYNLIPSLTAFENVALVTEIAAQPLDPDEALALVGLADERDRFPAQMSGGEQQRVAIARAIAKRPDLLFCDEPTGALDAATGRVVLDVLQRANKGLGTTTAIITHNAAIAGLADRVVRVVDGRVAGVTRNAAAKRVDEVSW
jgi:putative ABC transport system ATP-binding protein